MSENSFNSALGMLRFCGLRMKRSYSCCGSTPKQFGFAQLDAGHRRADGLGDVFLLRQVQQVVVPGKRAQREAALFDGDVLQRALTARALELAVLGQDGVFVLPVFVVGELQTDQAQHGRAVFAGLQVAVGAQLVGGCPEVSFELFELVAGRGSWGLCQGAKLAAPVECGARRERAATVTCGLCAACATWRQAQALELVRDWQVPRQAAIR